MTRSRATGIGEPLLRLSNDLPVQREHIRMVSNDAISRTVQFIDNQFPAAELERMVLQKAASMFFYMAGSLVRKLEQFTSLSDLEKRAALSAPVRVRSVDAHQDIVSEGSRPSEVSAIIEGFACRYELRSDGRRQVVGFLIPGDICDLRALVLHSMDHGALRSCRSQSFLTRNSLTSSRSIPASG